MSGIDDSHQDKQELQKYLQAGLCVNSVTHDVNNYLGAIMAYTELVAMEAGQSPNLQRMSAEIVASLEKSTGLLTTLTDLVRLDEARVASVDVAHVLEQTVNLFEHEMKRAKIFYKFDIQGDRAPVRISRGKLLRVFTHLMRNCIQRTREAQAKDITIQFIGESEEIVIYIKDLSGMDAQDREQSVDPIREFLDAGSDTMQEHVRFHKGELSYESSKGFVLRLPRDTGL